MPTTVSPRLRRARLSVSLMFLTNALVITSVLPRYPEIRTSIGATYGEFGIAIAMAPVGSLAFGLTAAVLIRRLGSARVATIGTLVAALTVVGYAFAPSVWWLGGLAFVVGSLDTIIDVAQNAHGLRVQAEYRRSILNSFHAIWSLGAVLGGLLGGAAAAIGMPLAWQFSATGLLVAVIAIAALIMALPGPDPEKTHEDGHAPAGLRRVPLRMWGVLTALTFVAIGGAWVEDAAMTWAASYLSDELSTGAGLAAAGLIAMMSMHFLGRIIGDRLVDRFGERAVARAGGILVIVAMGSALAWPSVPMTIIGFGLAGLGVATTIPSAYHGGERLPYLGTGTGLMIMNLTLRIGFLVSPVIVGALADAYSLRVGLLLIVASGVLVAVFAQWLPGKGAHAHEPATQAPSAG